MIVSMARFLAILVLLGISMQSAWATIEEYVNIGVVTNAQVDAYRFRNEGLFVATPLTVPWDSQNTTNFVNRGTMSANIGFRFDTVDPSFGFRRQANVFLNQGTILGADGGGIFPFSNGQFVSSFFAPDTSLILMNAANVTNHGDISVGSAGSIKAFGKIVDLTSGTLFVEDVNSVVSSSLNSGFIVFDNSATNFFPAAGVYDLSWGIDVRTNMDVTALIEGVDPNRIRTPPFNITNAFDFALGGGCLNFDFVTTNAQVFVREATTSPTNRNIQVIAVDVANTNIIVNAGFLPIVSPNGNPQGGYLSPLVEFRVGSTNFRTLTVESNSLYFFDQLGSQTNYNLSFNIVASTYRPAPFIIFRSAPFLTDFLAIPPNYKFLPPDIFTVGLAGPYSNNIVTNQYAVYSSQIESMSKRVPKLPDVGITNFPGRVEVKADQLVLGNTRIRGEGLISLNATNMIPGPDVSLDVPRLNFNFNTRSNLLRIPDMTPDSVERFGGYLRAYSTIWTNFYGEIVVVPGTSTNTNVVEVRFELLVLDGNDLHTREPVIAYELRLASTNGPNGTLVYEDNIAVTNILELSARNLTLAENSRLYLAKGVGFSYTNVTSVDTFTNLGTLIVNELADFRKTETEGYGSFVNRGLISAFGESVRANYFESTGDIVTSVSYSTVFDDPINLDCFGKPFVTFTEGPTEGSIFIDALTGKLDGGLFDAGGDISFAGQILKVNNHRATAGRTLFINTTTLFTDSGEVGGGNEWTVNKGFEMRGVRPAGDLLGTELRSQAARLAIVDHVWAAEDRGPSISGFQNNLALGRLTLDGDTNSILTFSQGTANSAIYVDVLEIENFQAKSFNQLTNRIRLGMNVYYGDAFSSDNPNFTAETLNKVFGTNASYNFYWVTNWAGPNSSVDVPLTVNGPVKPFNRALRLSKNIDSDGDGLPNFFDPFPFPPEEFIISGITVNEENGAVSVGFNTTQGARYIIEYTTDLIAPQWKELSQVLQTNSNGGILKFTDQVQAGHPQRFYRVRKAL
jgi:hypothetical protein